MILAVFMMLSILATAAQKCYRTQLFSFDEELTSSQLIESPWNEHIAAVTQFGTSVERDIFSKVLGTEKFVLLIDGFMVINGPHKLVSFYHLMGNSKNTLGHFFYKRWPIERLPPQEFKQLVRQCAIVRPGASGRLLTSKQNVSVMFKETI